MVCTHQETISLAELYDGVYSSKEPEEHETALMDFISGVVVLDITEEVCKGFGKLRFELRKKGRLSDNFDLIVASTAKTYGIVSRHRFAANSYPEISRR